ncbi:hypothetical protein EJ06DRAFT_533326 [Trichodelitschia bisporula]|uniref:Altered inheritance of mitochondria protein 32 n=1 Tax=Trichodelitschia bisporula TaxID=703511 RepID=A0A6G1HMP7_9PEZI|nr:hypothetical protein EJ06DRAFT_533326 [Trichodelitschia bisporula]
MFSAVRSSPKAVLYVPEKLHHKIFPSSLRRITDSAPPFESSQSRRQRRFNFVDTCLPPTCPCRETPDDPRVGQASANSSIVAYHSYAIMCSGKQDWAPKISLDESDPFARYMTNAFSSRGPFHNPMLKHSIINSSFQSTPSEDGATSVYLFPEFRYVNVPLQPESIARFIKGFMLSKKIPSGVTDLSPQVASELRRKPLLTREFAWSNVNSLTILICGHPSRKKLCSVLGPLLEQEFEEKLQTAGFELSQDPPDVEFHKSLEEPFDTTSDWRQKQKFARIGMTSHVGGCNRAGNVIIWIPPSFSGHPLAGTGVWYGNVEPRHVEGIVNQTIIGGDVIKELFRGSASQHGPKPYLPREAASLEGLDVLPPQSII